MKSFEQQMRAISNKTLKQAANYQKVIAGRVFAKVVARTPVGNPDLWDIPDSAYWNVIESGYKGGSLRAAWTLNQRDTGGDLNKFRSVVNTLADHQPIEISNRMPYARAVEYGHSWQQAPSGMVRISVRETKAEMKARKNLTGIKLT